MKDDEVIKLTGWQRFRNGITNMFLAASKTLIEMYHSGECTMALGFCGGLSILIGALTIAMVRQSLLVLGIVTVALGVVLTLFLIWAEDTSGTVVPKKWKNQVNDLYDIDKYSRKLRREKWSQNAVSYFSNDHI